MTPDFMKSRQRWMGKSYRLFRIPHKPLAGSLKVLRAPARWRGIQRTSQIKIYNLEIDDFVSNLPFLKINLAGVISQPTFWWEQL
jgi:hypothetical protein